MRLADVDGDKSLQLIRADVAAGVIPAPHSILKTSLNKYHIVWHVDGFTPEEAKALNKALARRFGGDTNATDVIRLLRMPGFKNLKLGYAQPVCELIGGMDLDRLSLDRYTREEFKIETTVLNSNPPADKSAPVFEGSRNNTLTSLGGDLRIKGFDKRRNPNTCSSAQVDRRRTIIT